MAHPSNAFNTNPAVQVIPNGSGLGAVAAEQRRGEEQHEPRGSGRPIDTPASARALLPCLLPLDTLKKIRDQNLLVLEPIKTLKKLRLQYRLHGKPQSLKAFRDLFLLENGEYDKHRAIWLPESDVFVCIDQHLVQHEIFPVAYREGVFKVALPSDRSRGDILSVSTSSTVEQAMPWLEFLFENKF
jgi:hypothetical protein